MPPLELVLDVPDLPTSLAFGHSLDQIVVLFDRFQCRTMRRRALVPIMAKHHAAQPGKDSTALSNIASRNSWALPK